MDREGAPIQVIKAGIALLVLSVGCDAPAASGEVPSRLMPGADEFAHTVMELSARRWAGPRVDFPEERTRPRVERSAISDRAPVAVHGTKRTSQGRLEFALAALEDAYVDLSSAGWRMPTPDGDLGGGGEFDLYLAPAEDKAGAHTDGQILWSYLDRASSFAVVQENTPERELAGCVTSAFAQGLLLSLDPAEAESWRQATGSWFAWQSTGTLDCWNDSALFLALLSARHDGGSGRFIREAWELGSQRTWEGQGLRASPDLWMAFETFVRLAGDSLEQDVEEFAVARYFAGRDAGPFPDVMAEMEPSSAQIAWRSTLEELPKRVHHSRPLTPYQTAFLEVLVPNASPGREIKAWLEGEYGVSWSFVSVQLDRDGQEVRRLSAPHTASSPRAFLPVQLEGRTTRVAFVVSNLSSRLPDADAIDTNGRAFEVTLTAEP